MRTVPTADVIWTVHVSDLDLVIEIGFPQPENLFGDALSHMNHVKNCPEEDLDLVHAHQSDPDRPDEFLMGFGTWI